MIYHNVILVIHVIRHRLGMCQKASTLRITLWYIMTGHIYHNVILSVEAL